MKALIHRKFNGAEFRLRLFLGVIMRGRKSGGQGHRQLRQDIRQAKKEDKRLSVFLKEKEAIIKKGK